MLHLAVFAAVVKQQGEAGGRGTSVPFRFRLRRIPDDREALALGKAPHGGELRFNPKARAVLSSSSSATPVVQLQKPILARR